jgi:hypothetical protein
MTSSERGRLRETRCSSLDRPCLRNKFPETMGNVLGVVWVTRRTDDLRSDIWSNSRQIVVDRLPMPVLMLMIAVVPLGVGYKLLKGHSVHPQVPFWLSVTFVGASHLLMSTNTCPSFSQVKFLPSTMGQGLSLSGLVMSASCPMPMTERTPTAPQKAKRTIERTP